MGTPQRRSTFSSHLGWARRTLGADGLILFAGEPTRVTPRVLGGVGLARRAHPVSEAESTRIREWLLRQLISGGHAPIKRDWAPECRPFRLARGGSGMAWAATVPVRSGRRTAGSLVALWRSRRALGRVESIHFEMIGRMLGAYLLQDSALEDEKRLEHSRQIRAFCRVARLSGTVAPQAVGARLLGEFCRALGFSRAEIWLFGTDHQTFWRFSSYGDRPLLANRSPESPVGICTFTRLVRRRRQGVHHPDVSSSATSSRQATMWRGVTSVFGASLRVRGKVIGVLYADRGGSRFDLTATDLEVGTALAALCAEVLNASRAHHRKAKRQRQMDLLNQANHAITAEENLTVLLPRLARTIRLRAHCLGVFVGLLCKEGREIELLGVSGPEARLLARSRHPVKSSRSSAGSSVRTIRSRRTGRRDEARILPRSMTWWPGVRTAVSVPIRSKGEVMGVLRMESDRALAFDEEDRQIFAILGEQIGHAVRRARVLEELHEKQADLRAVSDNLERVLEEDRRRIARELHDELAQSMTAANFNLVRLRQLIVDDRPEVRRAIRETEGIVQRTIEETRRISMDLRPPMLDDLGLLPALNWLAETFARRTGIDVSVRCEGMASHNSRGLKTLLYRFVQEALTNVARHARARDVQVRIDCDGKWVRAIVQDDGVGMRRRSPRSRSGLGILGMRERVERVGGRFDIESRAGSGTRLVAVVPAGQEAAAAPRRGRIRRGAVARSGPPGPAVDATEGLR